MLKLLDLVNKKKVQTSKVVGNYQIEVIKTFFSERGKEITNSECCTSLLYDLS